MFYILHDDDDKHEQIKHDGQYFEEWDYPNSGWFRVKSEPTEDSQARDDRQSPVIGKLVLHTESERYQIPN